MLKVPRAARCSQVGEKGEGGSPSLKKEVFSFPGGPEVKNLPCNARDIGLILGLGRLHMPWNPSAVTTETLALRAYTREE